MNSIFAGGWGGGLPCGTTDGNKNDDKSYQL
jgi:hypothetical protein